MSRLIACLVLLACLGGALPAGAQAAFDYGRLFGGAAGTAEDAGGEAGSAPPASGQSQQTRQSPQSPQSRPIFDPMAVPSAEAYGALTGQPVDTGMFGRAQRVVDAFRERLVAIVVEAPEAFPELWVTLKAASRTGEPAYFLGVAVFALVLLAVGRAVAQLFAAFIARPIFVNMQKPEPQGYRDKLPVLAYRVLLTVIGVALSVSAASAVGIFFHDGHEHTLNTVIIIFACYAGVMLIDTIWRMVLCPLLPNYRLPAIDTASARRLYRWLYAVSTFGICAVGFGYWVQALGLPNEIVVLFTVSLTALLVVAIVVLMRANAPIINRIILDGQPRTEISWVTLLALTLWAPLGVAYLVASWGKFAVEMVMGGTAQPLALTVPYFVVLGGTLLYAVACYVIERIFIRRRAMAELNAGAEAASAAEDTEGTGDTGDTGAGDGAGAPDGAAGSPPEAAMRAGPPPLEVEMQREEFGSSGDIDGDGSEEGSAIRSHMGIEQPTRFVFSRRAMQSFEDLARRVASLFAIGAGAYGLLYFWGGASLFQENMLLGIAEDVIDLAFVGYILFHATRIWIDRRIAEEGADELPVEPGEGEGGGTGASRLATLLPLVRSFVLGLIVIAILLAVASEIGLNVAPLFAGAGILGLAIGFGSQTLVRDILSGAFFLMDDAFRRGEYIDVGEVKGTVEKISLRSFQLRHHLGMLHTIPFGEIRHLTNFSRDWVMMKLPLRLTYDTDVERVRKLVKKLGLQLLDDPVIGDKFLQPLKSQGVIEMQDSAMIVRVKFMTKPGEQWVIRKRVFQEIRDLFEREGIHFAHREVTVRIPDLPQDRPLSDTEARAVGAGTRNALDVIEGEQNLAMAGGARGPVDDR
ncbi:hypothetical protein LNKW23_10500 [Paralimibaculum aggregatum]|uniref:Small-conductance mechanosensitive channel n=1 Tax=Paralimibaculum aggregatum TaxID=3036245 RepID=A0ABQ6LFT0_9RHOB|nr:mechanosensitive ion channel family protein [Limibaculum sp. NKW23]GMG81837.1 hypothetical protein LNKW23_10500 [Limibaculum sp. NKW23]